MLRHQLHIAWPTITFPSILGLFNRKFCFLMKHRFHVCHTFVSQKNSVCVSEIRHLCFDMKGICFKNWLTGSEIPEHPEILHCSKNESEVVKNSV